MRPSDLAKRLGISQQALNHMVGRLDTSVRTMQRLEADWQDQLDKERFGELKATLRALAGPDVKA